MRLLLQTTPEKSGIRVHNLDFTRFLPPRAPPRHHPWRLAAMLGRPIYRLAPPSPLARPRSGSRDEQENSLSQSTGKTLRWNALPTKRRHSRQSNLLEKRRKSNPLDRDGRSLSSNAPIFLNRNERQSARQTNASASHLFFVLAFRSPYLTVYFLFAILNP